MVSCYGIWGFENDSFVTCKIFHWFVSSSTSSAASSPRVSERSESGRSGDHNGQVRPNPTLNGFLILLSYHPVRHANRLKSSPISTKRCQKNSNRRFCFKSAIFKMAKKPPNIWATFERKFTTKNFQKSPNMVTLVLSFLFIVCSKVSTEMYGNICKYKGMYVGN